MRIIIGSLLAITSWNCRIKRSLVVDKARRKGREKQAGVMSERDLAWLLRQREIDGPRIRSSYYPLGAGATLRKDEQHAPAQKNGEEKESEKTRLNGQDHSVPEEGGLFSRNFLSLGFSQQRKQHRVRELSFEGAVAGRADSASDSVQHLMGQALVPHQETGRAPRLCEHNPVERRRKPPCDG